MIWHNIAVNRTQQSCNSRNIKLHGRARNPSFRSAVLVPDKLAKLVDHKRAPRWKTSSSLLLSRLSPLLGAFASANLTDRLTGPLNIREVESIYRREPERGCPGYRASRTLLRAPAPGFLRLQSPRDRLALRGRTPPFPMGRSAIPVVQSRAIRWDFITPSSTRLYRRYAPKMKTFSAPPFWFFHWTVRAFAKDYAWDSRDFNILRSSEKKLRRKKATV